ncbi:MAG: Alanine--tRNA ligase [Watsoniomyces obsoletus]|nr:MAG: Alanine--tRNA ligase [Watsoniomyces obsoletus]
MTSELPNQPEVLPIPTKDTRRFHPLYNPVEWIESYRPGRFHPVHLGDTFNDRYRVIRKLGYGSFSTVWLAKDLKLSRFVALKILISETSATEQESTILKHLFQLDVNHPGKNHIIELLDEFDHHGPNGLHRCLVFEAMGPSANVMVEELPEFKPRMYRMTPRYPLWMTKSMLKQALLGLDFLHQNGIAHSDFQPGNILFSVTGLESVGEEKLAQDDQEEVSDPVRRLDGKVDPWAPRYLAEDRPLVEYTDLSRDLVVKLSDMGGAFFIKDPPEKPLTPVGLRSPEHLVGGKTGSPQDIWSFGCLLFEFICAQQLFCLWTLMTAEADTDDEHLLMLHAMLGPVPQSLLSRWPRAELYFNAEGEQIKTDVDYDRTELNASIAAREAAKKAKEAAAVESQEDAQQMPEQEDRTEQDHQVEENVKEKTEPDNGAEPTNQSDGVANEETEHKNGVEATAQADPDTNETTEVKNGAEPTKQANGDAQETTELKNGTEEINQQNGDSDDKTDVKNGTEEINQQNEDSEDKTDVKTGTGEDAQQPPEPAKEEEEYKIPTLEEHFNKVKPPTLDADESATILSLLRLCLQYEAEKRPTAAALLKHPWFADPK